MRSIAPVVLGVLLSLSGCAVTLRAGRPPEVATDTLEITERAADRCIHGMTGPDSPYRVALPGPVTDPALLAALEQFPPAVRRTALAAGLEPLLARLVQERDRAREAGAASPELLAMRDELAARMYTLETQLIAMEFEVDCVRGLINARLSEYAESETDRQLALTIWSLVVGAGTALAAGIWDLANSELEEPAAPAGPLVVGIVGAVGTTALGTAVLLPAPQPIVYVHEHNVLRPLVSGEDLELVFPTFVFRLLTLPRPSGAPTPRDELLATWDELVTEVVPADQRSLADEILYGDGGVYGPQLLALHQELLEELGATLDGLARDIDLLASVIAVVLAADLPMASESVSIESPPPPSP